MTLAGTDDPTDFDAFFEYGYIWLPYAVAALVLLALGVVAAVRWRKSSPGTAELLFTSGTLLAVLAAIVLGLADGASENNGLAAIDPLVWQWMVDHRTPAMTTVAIVVTEVGSTVSMTIIAIVTIGYLLIKRRRGDAVLVAVVAAGAGLLVRVGKATVGRERPPVEYRLVTETNESFPSGHALASAAILGVVLVVLLPSIRSRGAADRGGDRRRPLRGGHRAVPAVSRRALGDRCARRLGDRPGLALALPDRAAGLAADPRPPGTAGG